MSLIFLDKILPEAERPVASPVMLVKPGPGKVAELVHHKATQLTGKCEDRCLGGRGQEKSQEGVSVPICVHAENWEEVRAGL